MAPTAATGKGLLRRLLAADLAWLLPAWLLAAIVALAAREPLAVLETRHLAVAWEMWRTGEWLVPPFNGTASADQPPLLYWLIHAGWAVAGVNDSWPRALVLALGLVGLLLTALLARRLWPHNPELPGAAALLVGGTLLWSVFATLIASDLLLVVTMLTALLGLVELTASEDPRRRRRAITVLAAGLSLGVLAQGLVALLPLAAPAVLAPWWNERVRASPGPYLRGVLTALAIGLALALAWAVPAALRAGVDPVRDLLTGITAGADRHAVATGMPGWLPAVLSPLLLLPWIAWRPALNAVREGWRSREPAVRFCVAWAAGAIALFALSGADRLQWLLGAVPAFMLVIGRGVTLSYATSWRADRFWPLLPLGVLATLLSIGSVAALTGTRAAWLPVAGGGTGWLAATLPWWPLAALALVGWGLAPLRLTPAAALRRLAVASLIGHSLLAAAVQGTVIGRSYDVAPAALAAQAFEQRGHRLAIIGPYFGEFHFAGRLVHPIVPLRSLADLRDLAAAAPEAVVAVHSARDPGMMAAMPIASFPYRRAWVSFWPAARLANEQSLRDRLVIRFPPPEAQ